MNNLKKRDQYIQEELKSWNRETSENHLEPMDISKAAEKYTSKVLGYKKQSTPSKEWDWIEQAFIDGFNYKKGVTPMVDEFDSGEGGGWVSKWNKTPIKENILPRPYPKVKCAECGEEVCDNINYKIGHLYNKHNCKPSVGDYKAKRMLVQCFPPVIK